MTLVFHYFFEPQSRSTYIQIEHQPVYKGERTRKFMELLKQSTL